MNAERVSLGHTKSIPSYGDASDRPRSPWIRSVVVVGDHDGQLACRPPGASPWSYPAYGASAVRTSDTNDDPLDELLDAFVEPSSSDDCHATTTTMNATKTTAPAASQAARRRAGHAWLLASISLSVALGP